MTLPEKEQDERKRLQEVVDGCYTKAYAALSIATAALAIATAPHIGSELSGALSVYTGVKAIFNLGREYRCRRRLKELPAL